MSYISIRFSVFVQLSGQTVKHLTGLVSHRQCEQREVGSGYYIHLLDTELVHEC